MAAPLYSCAAHGPYEGSTGGCPVCGRSDRHLLTGARRLRLSKFMSGALRHFPEDVGLALDSAGWADYDDLVAAVEDEYGWATAEDVAAVVATDPKGRFEFGTDQGIIRAAYGHSVDVTLGPTDRPVPDRLYHGTARGNVESIREEGLRPMDRQAVHLSGTVETAREVGRRRDPDPVVLAVDAAGMLADDHRIVRRGRDVYTTPHVPPQYLSPR